MIDMSAVVAKALADAVEETVVRPLQQRINELALRVESLAAGQVQDFALVQQLADQQTPNLDALLRDTQMADRIHIAVQDIVMAVLVDTDAVAEQLDYEKLASKVDAEAVAEQLDTSSLAEAVAGELDISDLADKVLDELDVDNIVEKVTEELDTEELAEELKNSGYLEERMRRLLNNASVSLRFD
jgi:hypothetical protein